MGNVISGVDGGGVDRRTFIKRSAIGAAVVGTALALPSMTGTARAGAGKLRIRIEDALFTANGETPSNFFVVGNIIRMSGTTVTGKFFCRGTEFFTGTGSALPGPSPGANTFVSHRFRIDGVGSLLGEGAEFDALLGGDDLAVIGGTGAFLGASGHYAAVAGAPLPFGNGRLTFMFDLG